MNYISLKIIEDLEIYIKDYVNTNNEFIQQKSLTDIVPVNENSQILTTLLKGVISIIQMIVVITNETKRNT